MVGLLLLQALSEYGRLDRKPPVTAGLIAANTLIYLRPKFLDPILPTLNQVCFNPHLILKNKDLKRFLLSALYHTGEPHLVYNMLSLLWKGIQLESRMGSVEFASMVAALLGMSQGITLLLAKALVLFGYKTAYYDDYSVGFSGVLFAMKVVLYSQSDSYAYVHGLMVPARYAAWAELILIQMLVPGVSFLGHLGGILAGIAYLYLTASHSAANNPFTKLIRGVTRLLGWPLRFVNAMSWPSPSPARFFGRGTPRRSLTGSTPGVWSCGACTYDNSGLLNVCEMCGTERNGNGFAPMAMSNDSYSESISPEELRQRRVERFGR